MISKKSLLVTTALSSLLLASTAYAGAGHEGGHSDSAAGQCHGVNACKGHGSCQGVGHECKGKNSCEGKGWLKMTKDMCEKIKDGKWAAMPQKS
ncbi:MAG: hypothetical protein O2999_01470 [Nitrospirae bacterium]|nr:hypothetical protein [Nitrospirota bacterium]MDA1302971.1 hypothetical protein [Nitrospirota bacterium]